MGLRAGDRLVHWQVARLPDQPYDVPPQPMQGQMDSLFFLTKDKNVIPHEYPCRTQYIAQARGTCPALPTPDWGDAAAYLPFGAEVLDLSGFWFRPTLVRGWARTTIVADQAGQAQITLGTCGRAVLLVNGVQAGWMAPTSRNAMAQHDISLPVRAGENEIAVYIEDLAERDARILLSCIWRAGPAARAVPPFPPIASAVEETLSAAHLDRTSYQAQPIVLVLPEPLPHPAQIRLTVAGDFMSHTAETRQFDLPAGARALDLGPSEGYPADYRHFTFDLTCQGFSARRVLGVEISHAQRQGPPPAALSDRIDEALRLVSDHAEPDTVRALARLASGRAGDETDAMIRAALPAIETCWDCADFALVPLIWARAAYGDDIASDLRARVDQAILGYRYWMDEPGDDVQWYFSENHALLFHTAAYLAGHLFPDARFVRADRSGAQQMATGRARVWAWLDHFETCEMAEFNSAPYFPIDLKGLCALFALAPDADIRARAERGILRLLLIVANSAHQGVMTAAQGRSYEHTLCAGDTLELSAVARLLWARGSVGARVHCLPQLAICLRDHGLQVPPELAARACWDKDTAQEWMFKQGQNDFARLYHHKTRETALGSAVRYRWGDWGYQETLLHGRLGDTPQAQIWINHPGETVSSGYGRPSYWGGSASVPRVQQYRDLAVVIFSGQAPQPDFTHAWFPTGAFHDWSLTGARALARSGRGMVLLGASGPLTLMDSGHSAGCELRLPGRSGAWVVRMGQGDDLAGFSALHAGLAPPRDASGDIQIHDAVYGAVVFHANGQVTAEGRRLTPENWTLQGTRRELTL